MMCGYLIYDIMLLHIPTIVGMRNYEFRSSELLDCATFVGVALAAEQLDSEANCEYTNWRVNHGVTGG